MMLNFFSTWRLPTITPLWLSVFFLWALSACQATPSSQDFLKKAVAIFDGQAITVEEFLREYRYVRLRNEEWGPLPASTHTTQKKALLIDLLQRRLLLAQAEQKHVYVSMEEVAALVERFQQTQTTPAILSAIKEPLFYAEDLKVAIRHLLLVRQYLKTYVFSTIAIHDEAVAAYIQDHPETRNRLEKIYLKHIRCQDLELIKNIHQRLQKERFEDLALAYGQGPEAARGGDLFWVTKGELPHYLEDIAFKLTPGKVSDIIQSDIGYHLLKVTDKTSAKENSLLDIQDSIEVRLRREQERLLQQAHIQELWQTANIQMNEDILAGI